MSADVVDIHHRGMVDFVDLVDLCTVHAAAYPWEHVSLRDSNLADNSHHLGMVAVDKRRLLVALARMLNLSSAALAVASAEWEAAIVADSLTEYGHLTISN